jgi:hypothetical protein
MERHRRPGQTFDTAALYTIVFDGEVRSERAQWLEGMEVQVITGSDGRRTTVVCVWVLDQAALMGILNSAYYQGIPLLSLCRHDEGGAGSKPRE